MRRTANEHGGFEWEPLVFKPDARFDPKARLRPGDVHGDIGGRREQRHRSRAAPRLEKRKFQRLGSPKRSHNLRLLMVSSRTRSSE